MFCSVVLCALFNATPSEIIYHSKFDIREEDILWCCHSNESSLVEIFQTTFHFLAFYKKKTSNLICLCALIVLQSRSSEGIAPSIWCSLQLTKKSAMLFHISVKLFNMSMKRPSKENDENYLKPSL